MLTRITAPTKWNETIHSYFIGIRFLPEVVFSWNLGAIDLDFFPLFAWLSLDDLHCVDLLQLSPWRGHPFDSHVSGNNGAFIIRSCTLWCTASSAGVNPRVCPLAKPRRTCTHTWQNTTPCLKETIDTLMSDCRPTVKPAWEPQNCVKSQLFSCYYKCGQLVLPHRIPRLASITVDVEMGKTKQRVHDDLFAQVHRRDGWAWGKDMGSDVQQVSTVKDRNGNVPTC